MKKLLLMMIFALVLPLTVFAGKDKKSGDEQTSDVKFEVIKKENGKPVRNAAVILHPVGKDGNQSRRGSELKTDQNGNTQITVPYGKVRIQVIAPGFQTYGEDFEFNEPQKTIVIKMNPPGEQYSIYK